MSNSSVETRRLFSYIFIFALAVLFALQWGPGARGCDKANRATIQVDSMATVNGKEIPLKDFQRVYGNQMANLRAQGLPPELAKQFGVDKQVIDALVNEELLAQAAENRGLTASDEDLKDTLIKNPDFQKDGKFDFDHYQQIIRDYEGVTEVAYEAKLRRALSAQRMRELVEASVVVSDDEVKAKFMKEGNTAKATFVRFSPTMFADKVTAGKPAEMKEWTAKNEADISAYYEKQKKTDFTTPVKVKARQILIRSSKEDAPEKRAEAKERIEKVRKEIVENKKPFAEMATQFSEDVETKPKGGDLGTVDRYSLPPSFADLLFAIKPGEVTLPVETPIGFLIGMIESKTEEQVKPLADVKSQIATQLWTREKAKAMAKVEADKALADVKAGKKLSELYPATSADKFATETKPESKETGEFNSSAESVPQLGTSPQVMKAVFDRKDSGPLELQTIGDAIVVINVDERSVPSDASFDKEKEKLRNEAVKAKQFEVREAFLKALKQTGSVVTNQVAIERVTGSGVSEG